MNTTENLLRHNFINRHFLKSSKPVRKTQTLINDKYFSPRYYSRRWSYSFRL